MTIIQESECIQRACGKAFRIDSNKSLTCALFKTYTQLYLKNKVSLSKRAIHKDHAVVKQKFSWLTLGLKDYILILGGTQQVLSSID